MTSPKNDLPANVDLIDPLGEIRGRAKELWQKAGSPSDRSWESFFNDAERDLTAGKSDGVPSGRQKHFLHEASLSKEFEALIESNDDILLQCILRATKEPIQEHDALCLGRILTECSLKLPSGVSSAPLTTFDAAHYLAFVSAEYSNDFIQSSGGSIDAASHADKQSYWDEKLSTLALHDEALTNADRNSIARIKMALVQHGGVLEINIKE